MSDRFCEQGALIAISNDRAPLVTLADKAAYVASEHKESTNCPGFADIILVQERPAEPHGDQNFNVKAAASAINVSYEFKHEIPKPVGRVVMDAIVREYNEHGAVAADNLAGQINKQLKNGVKIKIEKNPDLEGKFRQEAKTRHQEGPAMFARYLF